MNKRKTIIIAIVAALLGGSVSWTARGLYDIYNHKDLYSKLAGIESVLDNAFLYDYDKTLAADYAATAITMALDDPYTMYYNKQQFTDYVNHGSGNFIGIGITVMWDKEHDEIQVISVVDNSPAMEAGVLPGDVITAVEGKACTGSQMAEIVSAIRGLELENAENTPVTITVRRDDKNIDLTIIRKRIHEETVSYNITNANIGFIRISAFNRASETGEKSTAEEFSAAYEDLTRMGMKKLIIDLRDNGGGDLDSVSEIIDMIVPEGLIMYSEDKKGNRYNERKSDASEINIPTAVLVNGNSASAAELMTGALRDYDKAVIIGTKTFGKGIMQSVYPFSDGSGMTVTVAKYYTPSGICVHEVGITPDIEIQSAEEFKNTPIISLNQKDDAQLQAAIDYLQNAE